MKKYSEMNELERYIVHEAFLDETAKYNEAESGVGEYAYQMDAMLQEVFSEPEDVFELSNEEISYLRAKFKKLLRQLDEWDLKKR